MHSLVVGISLYLEVEVAKQLQNKHWTQLGVPIEYTTIHG